MLRLQSKTCPDGSGQGQGTLTMVVVQSEWLSMQYKRDRPLPDSSTHPELLIHNVILRLL